MASNYINSSIDSSNIIRSRSVRASKDKAIARIALPFDTEFIPPKKSILRSKSVKTLKNMEENLEENFRKSVIINIEDDDNEEEGEEDAFEISDCETESSQSSSELSSSNEHSSTDEEIDITPVATTNMKRNKSVLRGRKSTKYVDKSNICITKTEGKKMTPETFAELIPCRDNEFHQIYLSISTLLFNGDGGCIFVAGVPGTGKTASVSAVIDCLEDKHSDIPSFNRVTINGMHVTEVREVYSLIYKKLTGNNVSKSKAVQNLEKELFSSGPKKQKKPTVILIDEIDQLHTKKEDVLYKLFGWTQMRDSKLIIVAIANTMDMPERLTQNKVTSRTGLTRYIFEPYNHQQFLTILKVKLKQIDNKMEKIDSHTLEFVARKVATASCDVRRILEILGRILEFHKAGKKVDIALVELILKEMFSQVKISALRNNCSFYEKLFLRAMVSTFKSSGLEEAPLKDVLHHLRDLCQLEAVRMLNNSEVSAVLVSLGSYKLICFNSFSNDINLKLRLNCKQENINFALNNK